MSWVSENLIDMQLLVIQQSDEVAVCSAQPSTYFQAVRGALWAVGETYVAGDTIHPPTANGMVYECLVGGDAGAAEPAWSQVQDAEFTDGTVTWKSHENVSLANAFFEDGEITITDTEDPDPVGRKLMTTSKIGVVCHAGGIVSHTALLRKSNATVCLVVPSETTVVGDNNVIEGKAIIINAIKVISRVAEMVA